MAKTRPPTDPEPKRPVRIQLVTRYCANCGDLRSADPQTTRCNTCGWLTRSAGVTGVIAEPAVLRSHNPTVPDVPLIPDEGGVGLHLYPPPAPAPPIGETPDIVHIFDSLTEKRHCPCGGIAVWLLLGILRPTHCAFCDREIPQ